MYLYKWQCILSMVMMITKHRICTWSWSLPLMCFLFVILWLCLLLIIKLKALIGCVWWLSIIGLLTAWIDHFHLLWTSSGVLTTNVSVEICKILLYGGVTLMNMGFKIIILGLEDWYFVSIVYSCWHFLVFILSWFIEAIFLSR
jgi:hypothetical protein